MRKLSLKTQRLMEIVCAIVLFVFVSQVVSAKTQKTKATAVTNVQAGVPSSLQYQKNLAQAQAEYYRLQIQKMEESSFWQSAKEEPAAIMAGLAALVALVSFAFNYKATLRNKKDTQFYEALKRFRDSSPAVRCSSVGLLCRMAKEDEKSYFDIILRQLVTGISLEMDSIVLMHIRKAICDLPPINSEEILHQVLASNQQLQYDFVKAVADNCGLYGVEHVEDIQEEVWNAITSLNEHYDQPVIESLVKSSGWDKLFKDRLGVVAKQMLRTTDDRISRAEEAERELRIAAYRLAECVKVLDYAIRTRKTKYLDLMRCFLVNADLHQANLQGVSMREAFIQCADFNGAQLRDTKLAGVHFDMSSNFTKTNWWAADFYLQDQRSVDESLLGQLADRYVLEMAEHSSEAHPSVHQFCKIRNTHLEHGS